MRFPSHLATIALLAASTLAAHADTVYSSFGPGESYGSQGYLVGSTLVDNQVLGFAFVPTQTVTLSDAVLALSETVGTNPVNLYIESNVAGSPGSILDTLTQVGSATPAGSLIDFTCSSCSVLDAGTTYFLVALQSNRSTQGYWLSGTSQGIVSYNFIGSATGPWQQEGPTLGSAFEINGTLTATPEPSAIALLGTGILGLAGMARRKLAHAQ